MSYARTLAVMRKHPFLASLGEEGLKLLAFGSDPISLKPREMLFEAGDDAGGAILVLGGQLRLVPEASSLRPRVYSVGGLVDEVALLVPRERSATAIAQTSCEVVPLERTTMVRLLNEFPDAAQRLQRSIAKRTQDLLGEVAAVQKRMV